MPPSTKWAMVALAIVSFSAWIASLYGITMPGELQGLLTGAITIIVQHCVKDDPPKPKEPGNYELRRTTATKLRRNSGDT